jgi:mRNA-degrading endonuclease toxin of MazEF toxin-antitoxin module
MAPSGTRRLPDDDEPTEQDGPMSRPVWTTTTRAVSAARRLVAPGRAARTATGSAPRRLSYAPELDGAADPGEVVWASVTFEEDPTRHKDRPVLVVGRADERTVLALMLSSQRWRRRHRHWLPLGPGAWDGEQRESFVRLDRVLELDERGLRREGAVLAADRFERVCGRLRERYGWS